MHSFWYLIFEVLIFPSAKTSKLGRIILKLVLLGDSCYALKSEFKVSVFPLESFDRSSDG